MMKLYLLRHGNATQDFEKGLSELGKKQVMNVAKKVQAINLPIDQIYHSTKLRAKMTAELFAEQYGGNLPVHQMNGLGPDDDSLLWIPQLERNTSNILLVSHQPFLEMLTTHLIGSEGIYFSESTFISLIHDKKWSLEHRINYNFSSL